MERNVDAKYYFENASGVNFGNSSNLPDSIPSIKNFVGREEYLKKLRELYKQGERSFVLHGAGGVGKTATTLKFAGEIAKQYKAKVFVDMQGTAENPLSPINAMFNVVRQFEPQISADIPPSQLEGLFISFVQRQPTLIILDNAENEAQVADLINVKDACVLVSSRKDIQLTSGKTIRLRAMSPEDAENLLFSIAGNEKFEGRAGELTTLAGCLPMALKPLAKLLKKEFMTIARILKDYADKKKLLEIKDAEHDDLSVEASFALSYDALTDELKKYWRSLAIFPADFEAEAASAVFGLDSDAGWSFLEQLYDFSLVEKDAKSTDEQPRFSLHDLARVFTDAKLSEDERFSAQFLHAQHYSSIVALADQLQLNNEENYYIRASKLLNLDWNNITTGLTWAASFSKKDNNIAALYTGYSSFINQLFQFRFNNQEFIAWHKFRLKSAKMLKNKEGEATSLGSLGTAYESIGKYRKAIKYYDQYLEISREISYQLGEGNGLFNLGNAYFHLNEYGKAIAYYKQSLKVCRTMGERVGERANLSGLGNSYFSLGESEKAIEYHKQSLEISREIGDKLGESQGLGNLGAIYENLGEHQKSIKYHKQYLEISREIGDREGEGIALGNLGTTSHMLGEKEKACDLWNEAIAILEKLKSPYANIFRKNIKNFC